MASYHSPGRTTRGSDLCARIGAWLNVGATSAGASRTRQGRSVRRCGIPRLDFSTSSSGRRGAREETRAGPVLRFRRVHVSASHRSTRPPMGPVAARVCSAGSRHFPFPRGRRPNRDGRRYRRRSWHWPADRISACSACRFLTRRFKRCARPIHPPRSRARHLFRPDLTDRFSARRRDRQRRRRRYRAGYVHDDAERRGA